ncbi:hypothetical protein [Clostridium tyrobutyricum]|uniref:hypothetical protein n=1 Tax=Clostridium tyrobutyricum TaxID=1519 RepID=UPI00189CD0A9|nr:hypothetical protein [Clostridium tyrobutyricum]
MLYAILKNIIASGQYDKQDMINKLNVFFAYNQITEEQYAELMNKVTTVTTTSDTTSTTTPAQ